MEILFLPGIIIVLLTFGIYMTRRQAKKESMIQQLKIEMLENNYETLLQMYERKSILVHDMKNHMLAIAKMVEEDQEKEAIAYIAQITGEMQQSRNVICTDHKMLDSVLNMKIQEALEAQIKVQCKCDDMRNLKLTLVEICALFANLLDNAIEANKRLPTGAERKMDVVCKKRGAMLIVSVSNPVWMGAETGTETSFETTKEDKNMHGFGLLSVKKVIKGHDGYMKTDVRDNMFHIVVYLIGFKK